METDHCITFGDYALHDRIGVGGMAEIFLASRRGLEGVQRKIVIKRILPTLSEDDDFVRMFIEEAKLCVALQHPNIVQVYDLGEIDRQYFIAMEYVDGRDLRRTLVSCGKKRVGFPSDLALYIVAEVLKGLDYAHRFRGADGRQLGIIHRDVSPSNILLAFDGSVKVADFGIAKADTREPTAAGILKGKVGYMSPEQLSGLTIDRRADVYAAGIIMYELLTGRRMFPGKGELLALDRLRSGFTGPSLAELRPDIDPKLERIVSKALSSSPRDRFQSARAFHDALKDYMFQARFRVGSEDLSSFLSHLFLTDPDEIAWRRNTGLPPLVEAQQTGEWAPPEDLALTQLDPGFDYLNDNISINPDPSNVASTVSISNIGAEMSLPSHPELELDSISPSAQYGNGLALSPGLAMDSLRKNAKQNVVSEDLDSRLREYVESDAEPAKPRQTPAITVNGRGPNAYDRMKEEIEKSQTQELQPMGLNDDLLSMNVSSMSTVDCSPDAIPFASRVDILPKVTGAGLLEDLEETKGGVADIDAPKSDRMPSGLMIAPDTQQSPASMLGQTQLSGPGSPAPNPLFVSDILEQAHAQNEGSSQKQEINGLLDAMQVSVFNPVNAKAIFLLGRGIIQS